MILIGLTVLGFIIWVIWKQLDYDFEVDLTNEDLQD